KLLLPDISQTLDVLKKRGHQFRTIMPVVPHLTEEISATVSKWANPPEIVDSEKDKEAAFKQADVALAASGTVLLELGLYRVPMISIYRLDWLLHQFRFLIFGWSAALPNLILDEPLIPEKVGDMIRPGWLARAIEQLAQDGPERQIQLDGFDRLVSAMSRDRSPGVEAAKKIKELLAAK
ncbi:MAG: lipid-A-disaccharide synthase, partial [Pseudomonadota bacterium]